MSDHSLKDLNRLRTVQHYKDPAQEDFLLELNELLMANERKGYRDYAEQLPFIFVFGLPRSGTTLISQLIAHCFDVGYINNLMARFWLAPLTGIKLSRVLLGDDQTTDFHSAYAATRHLADIHEFGYFWRYWLKKEVVSDIVNAREKEQDIDWAELRRTLLNIQHQFGKAMVFKNIFGSYHIERFINLLASVLFIRIERDPLDVAISILDARQKFYKDLSTWWSSYPPEYEELKDLSYMTQIGGQIYFLRKLYDEQIKAVEGKQVVEVSYEDLCASPSNVLERIRQACGRLFGYELRLVNQPPSEFGFRQYTDRAEEKKHFKVILEQFDQRTPDQRTMPAK